MTGNLYPLIAVGTTSSDESKRCIADKWWNAPEDTFGAEFSKAILWSEDNNTPLTFCCYLPGGHVPGTMQFNGYQLLKALPDNPADDIASMVREFAVECDLPPLIYLGSLPYYQWLRPRRDIGACVQPYTVAGRTSLVIDKLFGWPPLDIHERILDGLHTAFAEVIGEGGATGADHWMRVPVMHAADANETLYRRRPELYVPPNYVIVRNVPDHLADADSAEKRRWKREQVTRWLKAGVHVVVDLDDLEGATFAELTA